METNASPRVLVVEDDESTRKALIQMLGGTYCVTAATDGIDALMQLAEMDAPDVIVCDVMMPRLSGFDLVRSLKKDHRLARVPIVFLTALDAFESTVEGINLGARHYVTKPFTMKSLLQKIATAVGRKS